MPTQNILCTVVGLQDHPVAATAPSVTGQLLTWNGSAWQPGGQTTIDTEVVPVSSNSIQCGTSALAWSQVNAYALNNLSDPRLKKDIARIPTALDWVMDLPPKTFRFKSEPDNGPLHYGFLTTDVQEIIGKHFAGVKTGDDPNRTQTLSYHELVPILWRAVQELAARVAELEGK
jgi:hypothetical protein